MALPGEPNQILEFLIVGFTGLAFGSFATAVTYRVPRSLPWAFEWPGKKSEIRAGRSVCPSCKTVLRAYDLVPVFSWLLRRGKCAHCKASIGMIYPLIEIATLLLTIGVYCVFGLEQISLPVFLLVPFLVALFAIDCQHMILPNQLVFIVGLLGLVYHMIGLFSVHFLSLNLFFGNYLAAAVIYPVLLWLAGVLVGFLLKKEALGMGDVKFFAAAGIWLGMGKLAYFLIFSGFFGALFGIIWRKFHSEQEFPFGPALITAFYVLLLGGGSLFP